MSHTPFPHISAFDSFFSHSQDEGNLLEALRRALPPLQPLHMGSQMPKLSELDATRTIHEGWLFKVLDPPDRISENGPLFAHMSDPLFAISQDLIHPKNK